MEYLYLWRGSAYLTADCGVLRLGASLSSAPILSQETLSQVRLGAEGWPKYQSRVLRRPVLSAAHPFWPFGLAVLFCIAANSLRHVLQLVKPYLSTFVRVIVL